jgi:LytS/YehU family sensor histidine kinase
MSDENELIWVLLTGGSASAALLYYFRNKGYHKRIQELEQQVKNQVEDLHRLEVDNATTKLNPHLLKNTLNTIYSFSWQTTRAIEQLSEMLKYILNQSNRKYVTLNEELEFLNAYYEVHKLKLSPHAKIHYNVKPSDRHGQLKIAPLITVNFMENAFVHGDYTLPEAHLNISISVIDNILHYEVTNTFSPSTQPPGMGNENFRKRLNLLHKDKYEFQSAPNENTFRASLKLTLYEN